jgi:hypothetical protein
LTSWGNELSIFWDNWFLEAHGMCPVLNLLNFTALTHFIACGCRYEESDFGDEESEEESEEDDESVANGEPEEPEGM